MSILGMPYSASGGRHVHIRPRAPDIWTWRPRSTFRIWQFGVNTELADLPWFGRLLAALRAARVPALVVNVDRYGGWEDCNRAHCQNPDRFPPANPTSVVLAIERLAREHGTALVSLHSIAYAMLGCAVLCYAVLCCAMLCYAILCYAMLCCARSRCGVRCTATWARLPSRWPTS